MLLLRMLALWKSSLRGRTFGEYQCALQSYGHNNTQRHSCTTETAVEINCLFDFACVIAYFCFIFREYTKHAEDFFQTPGASANAGKAPASDDDEMEEEESDEDDRLPILAGRRRLQRRVDDSDLSAGSNGSSEEEDEADEMELVDEDESTTDSEDDSGDSKGKGKKTEGKRAKGGGAGAGGGSASRSRSASLPLRSARARTIRYQDPATVDEDAEVDGDDGDDVEGEVIDES